MVSKHIARVRLSLGYKASRFFIFVERNLGFEAGKLTPLHTSLTAQPDTDPQSITSGRSTTSQE